MGKRRGKYRYHDAPLGKMRTSVVPRKYDWGLYLWKKADGHLFHDGEGNLLNVPGYKNDPVSIKKIRDVANYNGEGDGEPWFVEGLHRVSDEEYSEQKDRMKNGEILLNDLGAVHDAQQTLRRYGTNE